MELIYGANTLRVPPRWTFAEHAHYGLEVVGVSEGQLMLVVAGKLWSVQSRQVITIPPHLPHGWYSTVDTLLHVVHLVSAPRDLTQRLIPGNQIRVLTLSTEQFIEYHTLFSHLAAIGDHAQPQQARLLRAYLEAFLITLVAGDREQQQGPVAIYEIAAYMQMHLDEPLTIVQVAQQFLMSEVTLRRRFQAIFGISPKQYLLELRLNEAQYLLATTHLSIKEIAASLSFFDLAHFSSTFRRRFGVSPTQWRAREQK